MSAKINNLTQEKSSNSCFAILKIQYKIPQHINVTINVKGTKLSHGLSTTIIILNRYKT